MALSERSQIGQQPLARPHAVHLVDGGDRGAPGALEPLERQIVLRGPFECLEHQHHDVGLLEGRGGGAVHGLVQGTTGLAVQTRGVEEGDLNLRGAVEAEDAVARGLRPGRDDAQLLAQEGVQQRRLADVRAADERGEAAAVHRLCGEVHGRILNVARAQRLKHLLGGRLFGTAAARAASLGAGPERGYLAAHRKVLCVVGALHGEHRIAGQLERARLQVFLQARLGVLERLGLRERGDARAEQPLDHRLHGGKAAVEEDRPAERFQGIGEDRLAAEPAALELPGPQLQRLPERELRGDLGEGLAADEPGTQAA
jgi:hypothetical protein